MKHKAPQQITRNPSWLADEIPPVTADTLANRIEEWLETKKGKVTEETLNNLKGAARRFELFVGTKKINPQTFIDWRSSMLADKLKPGGINERMYIMRSFFKWLEDTGRIHRSPTRGLKLTLPVTVCRKSIGPSDYERMRDAYRGTLTGYIVTVCYRTGMRISDACLLKKASLDFDEGLIRYAPLKTVRFGTVLDWPLVCTPGLPGYDLYEELQRCLSLDWSDWASFPGLDFVNPEAASHYLSSRYTARHLVTRAARKLGIDCKSRYFRRAMFTNLAATGVDPAIRVKMVGNMHKSFSKYVVPSTKLLTDVATQAYQKDEERRV